MHTGNTYFLYSPGHCPPVYPCAYREHGGRICYNYLNWRFIPVHTGNTNNSLKTISEISVYPCAYREHGINHFCASILRGLSLCIQGTLQAKLILLSCCRFIPVYTGNTTLIQQFVVVNSVYPCVYREHIENGDFQVLGRGLSLCIQGTRRKIPLQCV